jgi:hypothetical protein
MEGKQISVGRTGEQLSYACNSLPTRFSWQKRDISSVLTIDVRHDTSALAEGQQSFQSPVASDPRSLVQSYFLFFSFVLFVECVCAPACFVSC